MHRPRRMPRLDQLPARADGGAFHVVVETPAGSRAKLKYDPQLGAIVYGRPLVLGISYPYDWGFVPSTRAPDGDPLDAMVLADAATFPGVVVTCRAIGVVKVSQKKEKGSGRERNDRVIAVPTYEPRWEDARDLPKRVKEELEQFFVSAVLFEGKGVRVEGWDGPSAAEALVREAERAAQGESKKGKKR